MASAEPVQRRRRPQSWPDDAQRHARRRAPETTYETLTSATWLVRFAVFVLAPLMALRLIGLDAGLIGPHLTNGQPYEIAYRGPLAALGRAQTRLSELTPDVPLPWPQYEIGVPGWYRQGLIEVREHQQFIRSLMPSEEIAIILAAAIFNQANSPQRPFGWEGLERAQVWLGQHIDWPLARWPWAYTYWNAWFEQYSVGVGQITPAEVKRLGFTPSKTNLFDDQTSIRLMAAKMAQTYYRALHLGLDRTDALLLMIVSNNNDFDTIESFHHFDQNVLRFLRRSPYGQRQLTRMMTYIHHLHVHEGWSLPADIDWDYLCRLANTSWDQEYY